LTQEYTLELHHARIGEQECGVVLWYKRRTLSSGVSSFLKEREKLLPDLGGRHRVTLRESCIH